MNELQQLRQYAREQGIELQLGRLSMTDPAFVIDLHSTKQWVDLGKDLEVAKLKLKEYWENVWQQKTRIIITNTDENLEQSLQLTGASTAQEKS